MKEELKIFKKSLEIINERIRAVSCEQEVLISEDMLVGIYVGLEDKKKKLLQEKKATNATYTKLVQKNCNDPLWYFLSSSKDGDEGQEYWTCACFECRKIVTGNPKQFKKYVRVTNPSFSEKEYGDFSFQNLLGKYIKYKSSKPNTNVTNNTMIKKYNIKN